MIIFSDQCRINEFRMILDFNLALNNTEILENIKNNCLQTKDRQDISDMSYQMLRSIQK